MFYFIVVVLIIFGNSLVFEVKCKCLIPHVIYHYNNCFLMIFCTLGFKIYTLFKSVCGNARYFFLLYRIYIDRYFYLCILVLRQVNRLFHAFYNLASVTDLNSDKSTFCQFISRKRIGKNYLPCRNSTCYR